MKKYKGWDIYEALPLGWKIDKTVGSPLHGFCFCTDGKSVLNGGKRALVRTIRKGHARIKTIETAKDNCSEKPNSSTTKNKVAAKSEQSEYPLFPAKTVNTLARKKFQEQLLKEIQFDLMICEIEGWDKTEYIKELQKLLNSIDVSEKKKRGNNVKQQTLFDELT